MRSAKQYTYQILLDQLGYTDSFGKHISDTTQSHIDIGAHYPINAERLRLFIDGTRQQTQYGATVSQYEHVGDAHRLKPAAGETVTLRTTERGIYAVHYLCAVSWAIQLNQALQSGDSVSLEYTNQAGNDGWKLEHNDTHAPKKADLIILRDGTEQNRIPIDLSRPLTQQTRLAMFFNWYNAGDAYWIQTYTANESDSNNVTELHQQINKILGYIAPEGETDRGPKSGNQFIKFSVTAGSGTTGLEVDAGSVGFVILGDGGGIVKTKTAEITTSGDAIPGTGNYVPIAAIRRDPDRDNVLAEIINIQIHEFTGAGDVQLLAQSFDNNDTDASGFSTPPEHSSEGSVVEQTKSVTNFVDSSGNTQTAASDPGGYQMGFAALYSSGSAPSAERSRSQNTQRRSFSEDIIVILAKATVAGDVKFTYTTEQKW